MTEHPSILCAGGAVQDIVMRVDAFPAAGTKVQASSEYPGPQYKAALHCLLVPARQAAPMPP